MSISPDLPPDLRGALDKLAHGMSRNAMAPRAAAQSATYRAGGGSQAITTFADALAYAFTRLPATYAAAVAVFGALHEVAPAFAPRTMLDVGAGPGTAAFAATRVFAGLDAISLIDANATLRDLALTLMGEADSAALRHVVNGQRYRLGDALALLDGAAPADLVVASYAAGEMRQRELARFASRLWAATDNTLVVIEPGTPAGYDRIMGIRTALIAAGAYVAAPCPHERACPLAAPDWCHFAQRLPRSRDHLRVKGAVVPFEDEKFSYVVLTRDAPRRIDARVLAPPKIAKSAITAKLCTGDGLVVDTAGRRDADAYRRRRSWRWGDEVAR
jgi:ribosomal protein RSM22 (predicted rRNA methylase)